MWVTTNFWITELIFGLPNPELSTMWVDKLCFYSVLLVATYQILRTTDWRFFCFQASADRVKRKAWWQNRKVVGVVGTAAIVVIVIIIIASA